MIDTSVKIADYNFGPLHLKVVPFGLGQKINVGKILVDGSIQFNWPLIDLNTIENSNIFMKPLKSVLLGMSYCEDENGEGKMEKKVLQESLENNPDHIQWLVKSFVKINYIVKPLYQKTKL